ncbi:hypothetical protein Tco_0345517 [Tanacetum coccineum]
MLRSVTQQNLPQIRKQAVRNTNVIAPGPSRNCPKHVSHQSPREKVGSNDMVHNYYLEKAKKSAQLQKDKIVNGNLCINDVVGFQNKDVHLGEHRKQKPFLKFNDLQCPTCKKCLYSANHDECVLEYLSRLNPRASAQNKDAKSHKTTKRYMPVEKSSASKKPERQIPTGHRFSNKKTTTVPEKTNVPRSCSLGGNKGSDLAPQRQMASAENNTPGPVPQCLVLHQMTSDHNRSELGIQDHSNEQSSSKLVPKSCSLSNQDSYITTRVGITIPPSHSNAEDNSHKVVRLGINPMIQPEPEDLPKDNPKLEIAVLRYMNWTVEVKRGTDNIIHSNANLRDILLESSSFKDKRLLQTMKEAFKFNAIIMSLLVKDISSQDGKTIKTNDKGSKVKIA